MIFIKSFVVGGIICAIVQVIINKTKLTPGRIMVGLVCLGVILGAIGLYQPFADWAGCGATVPLLGFGNNLWKGMKEAIGESGVLGLFKGGFTSGAVGISGALIFGYLASLIFKSCSPGGVIPLIIKIIPYKLNNIKQNTQLPYLIKLKRGKG